ncbi:MAG: hypothetical protein FJZ64_03195 [Chlamydiae bacterium]|nr:hypothetical protein [Chlamydiota bacterium]
MRALSWLFLLFIAGCQTNSHPLSSKEKAANESLAKAAYKLKKETSLRPFGTSAQMMHQIEMLGLAFQYRDPIDLEKGRKLLVLAVNTLVETVNATPDIHQYLSHDPFLPQNARVTIFIQNTHGQEPEFGKLSIIRAKRGNLEYDIRDLESPCHLKTIFTETYEEAVQRLKSQESLPLRSIIE